MARESFTGRPGRGGCLGGLRHRGNVMSPLRSGFAFGLVMVLVLSGCAPESESPGESPKAVVELEGIDVSAEPEGPSVGELVTVADFQEALGTDDLTLSAAT